MDDLLCLYLIGYVTLSSAWWANHQYDVRYLLYHLNLCLKSSWSTYEGNLLENYTLWWPHIVLFINLFLFYKIVQVWTCNCFMVRTIQYTERETHPQMKTLNMGLSLAAWREKGFTTEPQKHSTLTLNPFINHSTHTQRDADRDVTS